MAIALRSVWHPLPGPWAWAWAMAPILGLLALFHLICARYGAAVHLWGDEAYALALAAKPLGEILAADPFHLPTYSLLGRGWVLWGVMSLTILLPNFIFSATNIRMYALLFAACQAFLWTSFGLLSPGGDQSRQMAWHLFTALLALLAAGAALAKALFFATRPLLDLVDPPAYPLALNGLLWLLVLVVLPVAVVVVWRGSRWALPSPVRSCPRTFSCCSAWPLPFSA